MNRFFFYITIALSFWVNELQGQALHYSQFYLSPQTTNSAQIGEFNGTVRIGALHRNQWLNVLESGIATTSMYIDSPISRGFRPQDWIGVGFGIVNDRAGVAHMNIININLGLSYHLSLSKNQKSVLSIGGQLATNSVNIDDSGLNWADEIISGAPRSFDDIRLNSFSSTQFNSISAGIQWKQRLSKQFNFKLGFAIHNLNEPKFSFFIQPDSIKGPPSPQIQIISGQLGIKLNKKMELEPLFLVQTMTSDKEILAGVNMIQEIGKKKNKLQYGLAYRLQDALIFYLGLINDSYRLGFSYDLTISEFASYSPVNFELGGYYIIRKYKKPKIHPFIFCPRY